MIGNDGSQAIWRGVWETAWRVGLTTHGLGKSRQFFSFLVQENRPRVSDETVQPTRVSGQKFVGGKACSAGMCGAGSPQIKSCGNP